MISANRGDEAHGGEGFDNKAPRAGAGDAIYRGRGYYGRHRLTLICTQACIRIELVPRRWPPYITAQSGRPNRGVPRGGSFGFLPPMGCIATLASHSSIGIIAERMFSGIRHARADDEEMIRSDSREGPTRLIRCRVGESRRPAPSSLVRGGGSDIRRTPR